jgi:hypothetical protein
MRAAAALYDLLFAPAGIRSCSARLVHSALGYRFLDLFGGKSGRAKAQAGKDE